jgi:hypothetical protein
VSEGNQGPRPESRTPVSEDDRPTAETAAVGRPAAERSGRSGGGPAPTPSAQPSTPASSGPSRPPTPGRPATRPAQNGPGPNRSGSYGQGSNPQGTPRPGGPQPSASGWTPPPLPGRQTPLPPTQPAAARPAAAGSSRPGPAAQPATPARPGARPAAAAGTRTGSLPLPKPAEARPARPVAEAPRTDPGEGTPVAEASAAGPAPAKVPFWRRITDGLGIELKSGDKRSDAAPVAGEAPPVTGLAAAAKTAQSVSTSAPQAKAAAGVAVAAPRQSPVRGPQDRTSTPYPTPAPTAHPAGAGPIPNRAGSTTAVVPALGVQPAPAGTEAPAGAPRPRATALRRTRKARLRLSRLDPWSVMKTSFLFSIAAGIMLVVAVYAVWAVLSTSGLFASINDIVASVVSTPGDTTPFRVEDYLSTQRIMGVTALIACVDVVIFTALATLGSFLYNLAATMLGGLEITLAED